MFGVFLLAAVTIVCAAVVTAVAVVICYAMDKSDE